MALNPLYVIASDIEQFYVDKDTGLPLAGGQIYFYRDSERTVLKNVYELNNYPDYGYAALPNPLTLSSVGTVQDSGGNNVVIYWYPWITDPDTGELDLDLYYVVVTDSAGTVQFTRGAWPNTSPQDNPTETPLPPLSNQISNPTFTNTFLDIGVPTVITVSAASSQIFPIGPKWSFVISGTGTVTVQQIAVAGDVNCPTSPPYVLDVAVSEGITLCNLVQTFAPNSGLWASTGNTSIFLSGSFVAQNMLAGNTGLTLYYNEPSGLNVPVQIVTGSFASPYQIFQGVTVNPIPESTSAAIGANGTVQIYISFTANTHVQLTSIQVVPVSATAGVIVQPDLSSSNREEAFQGDYYIPRLNTRPATSYLTAWNFQENPFQFGVSGTITTTPSYICDQTIACGGSTGNISWNQDSFSNGLQFTASGSNDAFYIMQYLDGDQAKEIFANKLSVNTFAYQGSQVASSAVMRTYLFTGSSNSNVPTLPSTIGVVNSSGIFSITVSNWVPIPRSNLPVPQASLNQITNYNELTTSNYDYGFNGWQVTDSNQITSLTYFAIVNTFAYVTSGTQFTVNSISCNPGDIPSRPAPKTPVQTIQDCEYYYEKSYDVGTLPGAATPSGVVITPQYGLFTIQSGTTYTETVNPRYIPIRYKTPKRVPITPTFYSPSGNASDANIIIYNGNAAITSTDAAISNWTVTDAAINSCALAPANRGTAILSGTVSISGTVNAATTEAIATVHYVCDARLGIV